MKTVAISGLRWHSALFAICLFASLAAGSLLVVNGCGSRNAASSNQQKQRIAEMNALLSATELYQTNHGRLPGTLAELTANDPLLYGFAIREFSYSPTGVVVLSGTNWIISATNPANPQELILGRLPNQIITLPKPTH